MVGVVLKVRHRLGRSTASGPVWKPEQQLRRAHLCCMVPSLVAWVAEPSVQWVHSLGAGVWRTPLCYRVSILFTWVTESSTRLVHGLRADMCLSVCVCLCVVEVCTPGRRLQVVLYGIDSGR